MAYDEHLVDRIREQLIGTPGLGERKMFGGVAFLHHGHMFAGVSGCTLMLRVGKEAYAGALARAHVREMDFTGRPMAGYVYVDPPGLKTAAQLNGWLQHGLAFVATLPPKAAAPARAPARAASRPARRRTPS